MNKDYQEFVDPLKNILKELTEIEKKGCNDYSIKDLETLIENTYQFSKRIGYYDFGNNVRQTIEKQLYFLQLNRSKPKKRMSDWDDTISNFRQDLTDTISMIEFSD